MRQFVARVVWNSVFAVACLLIALVVAIVYLDDLHLAVLVLVGGGVIFAILSTRP